jgi:pyridinium-3,5-bisthiocarboxylic acid mononucleotide nickel chelatase
MPVPPPAVALLIEGFPVIDDGRAGERVTPTGAAIIRHLAPGFGLPRAVMRHGGVGYGFGTKRFPGISNVLRVTAFERSAAGGALETVGILRFEIDDQTPEDLAVGLERLRAKAGVIDVLQGAALGKKGRMVAQIQVLTQDFALEAVAEMCLAETTTLGVRMERVARRTLSRESASVTDADGRVVRVKTALRPDGTHTTKAEMDDIAAASGDHADRANRRARIERAAPGGDGSDG